MIKHIHKIIITGDEDKHKRENMKVSEMMEAGGGSVEKVVINPEIVEMKKQYLEFTDKVLVPNYLKKLKFESIRRAESVNPEHSWNFKKQDPFHIQHAFDDDAIGDDYQKNLWKRKFMDKKCLKKDKNVSPYWLDDSGKHRLKEKIVESIFEVPLRKWSTFTEEYDSFTKSGQNFCGVRNYQPIKSVDKKENQFSCLEGTAERLITGQSFSERIKTEQKIFHKEKVKDKLIRTRSYFNSKDDNNPNNILENYEEGQKPLLKCHSIPIRCDSSDVRKNRISAKEKDVFERSLMIEPNQSQSENNLVLVNSSNTFGKSTKNSRDQTRTDMPTLIKVIFFYNQKKLG